MALLVLGSLVGSGNCDFDSVDTAPANAPRLTINNSGVATAILHEHPTGQAQNIFSAQASQNDVDLFRFALFNNTGAAVTVSQIVFPLSAVSGIVTGDLSDLRIKNGVVDVTTGGIPSITGPTGTITFNGSWAVPASTMVYYALTGDVANLTGGDALTLSLGAGNITLAAGTMGGLAPPDATHASPAVSSLISYSDYAASGNRPKWYSTYAGSWTAPGAVAVPGPYTAPGYALHWKVARTASGLDRQAVVFQENDLSGRDRVWASFWDGTNWDDGAGAPFADAQDFGPTFGTNFRNFDAAFEDRSGRLMVVAGVNTDESVKWWRHDGATTWSAGALENVANNIQDPSNIFEWVRLAPRPGTNQVAFMGIGNDVTNLDSAVVSAMIWDGDLGVRHSKYVLNFPSSQTYHTTDAGDIRFVLGGPNVGEAVAVWGSGEFIRANVWNPQTGWPSGTTTVADLGVGNDVKWLRLEAEPAGRGMVLAVEDINGRIATTTYDATTRTWGALSAWHTTTAYGSAAYNRPFDITWDPASGASNVILAYSDATGIHYALSTNRGQTFNSPVSLDAVNRAYWIQLEGEPRPQGSSLRLLYHDQNDDLDAWSWNGAAWNFETSGSPISLNVDWGSANHDVEAFGLASFPQMVGPSGATLAADPTTAVALMGLEAVPLDSAVELQWRTGSELNNLGFHLHRSDVGRRALGAGDDGL